MPNERLRDALMSAGLPAAAAAEKIGVDAKTVERWMTKTECRTHATGAP